MTPRLLPVRSPWALVTLGGRGVGAAALAVCFAGCEDPQKGAGGADTGDGGVGGDGGDGGANYEEGCITVDGAGGYRWINDAITVATDGAVISLCAESAHEEEVLVNKAVTIEGPGAEAFTLVAPTNTVGLTITASGAKVLGLRVESTRTAVSVEPAEVGAEGPADVELSGVIFANAGNWGLSVNGATDVIVRDSVFSANGYGGLHAEGASVTVEAGSFVDNIGYGVHADSGASVTLLGGEVRFTAPTNPEDIADGHGMYAVGGSAIAGEGVVFADNTFVNVFAEDGDLRLTDSELTGALYGVVALAGEVVLERTSITNGAYHGVYAVTPASITAEALTIAGDPALTVDIPDATWGVADADGAATYLGVGAFLVADTVTVSGLSVDGYNNGGALIAGYSASGATASLASSTFTNNGRKGVYVSGTQATLTDVNVSGLIEVEDQGDDRCGFVDRYGAIMGIGATVTVIGGSVIDNAGYGLSNVQGVVVVDGFEAAGNVCAGVMNFRGSAEIRNSDFSRPGELGLSASVLDYESNGLVLVDSTFHDSQTAGEQVYEYDYTDYIARYVYEVHFGADLVAYRGARVEAEGNRFSTGTTGIQLIETPAELISNEFDNYLSYAIYAQGTSSVRVRDSAFSNFAASAVECYQSNVTIEDSSFTESTTSSEGYAYYQDDVLIYEGTSQSLGRGYYGYDCNLSMDSIEVGQLEGGFISGYTNTASSYVLNAVSIDGVALNSAINYQSAIDISTYYGATDISLTNVVASNVGEYGFVEVYNDSASNAYTGTVNVELDTVEVSGVSGAGVQLTGDGVTAQLTDVAVTGSGLGVQLEYGSFTLDGVSATSNVDSGGLTWGGSGIYLNGGSFTMIGASATSNAGYGLVCNNAPTIDSCSAITLSDNIDGESYNCDAACGWTP